MRDSMDLAIGYQGFRLSFLVRGRTYCCSGGPYRFWGTRTKLCLAKEKTVFFHECSIFTTIFQNCRFPQTMHFYSSSHKTKKRGPAPWVSLHRFLFNPQEGLSYLLKIGSVFSRIATKDDLRLIRENLRLIREDLRLIREDLRLIREDLRLIKNDVRLMNDSLLAPAGDAEAKKATVVIRFKKQGINTLG
jgi:hypothetical protein